jgi:hypothetical protein
MGTCGGAGAGSAYCAPPSGSGASSGVASWARFVTALGAGTAAERAARVVVATVDERARATIGSGSIFPSGSLVGIPCAAVN